MSFLDSFNTSVDQDFQKRMQVAIIKVAHAVVGEAVPTNPSEITTYNKRFDLGMRILRGEMLTSFCLSICAVNPVITVNSSDQDIEYLITTVFNDLAGVQ